MYFFNISLRKNVVIEKMLTSNFEKKKIFSIHGYRSLYIWVKMFPTQLL